MLQARIKDIGQFLISRVFLLLVLSGALCLLSVINASAQVVELSVTKTASADFVTPGSTITYTITVRNNYFTVSSAARLNDNLPGFTTFVSLASNNNNFSCTASGVAGNQSINCFGSLNPDESAQVTVVVRADAGSEGSVIVNTAVVEDLMSLDINQGNNQATATTRVTIPTAALVGIGGRVITSTGRGIPNVLVTLTDSTGNTRTTPSTSLGYYRFDDVQVGETYILTASGKGYRFSQPVQVLNVNEETNEINFIANSEKKLRVF